MAVYKEERRAARQYYVASGGMIPLSEIARQVGRPASTVRDWKREEGWDRLIEPRSPGNHPDANAKPDAVPGKIGAIMDAAQGMDEKELLWKVILFQYASIVRAQELMYVRDGDDTRFLAKGEGEGDHVEYEPHAAWDRHAAFMQAQSRAVAAFNNSLKAYQQLAMGAHTADARQQQAKLLEQKVKKMTEAQSPEIHIHTHIPRPPGTEGTGEPGNGNGE